MFQYVPQKKNEDGSTNYGKLLCLQHQGYFLYSREYGESLSKIFFRLSCMEEEGWVIQKITVPMGTVASVNLSSQDLVEETLKSSPNEDFTLNQSDIKQRIQKSVLVESDTVLHDLIKSVHFADTLSAIFSKSSPSRKGIAQAGATFIKNKLNQP